MTAQRDALQLLHASRTEDEAALTSVIAHCDKDAVIRALLDHFYGIDDAYFGATTGGEDVLDRYLEFAGSTSPVTIPS